MKPSTVALLVSCSPPVALALWAIPGRILALALFLFISGVVVAGGIIFAARKEDATREKWFKTQAEENATRRAILEKLERKLKQ